MKGQFFKKIVRSFSTSMKEPLDSSSILTRVRIWESGYFTEEGKFIKTNVAHAMFKSITTGAGNIGHVSLETKDFYASLWPTQLTLFNKYKIQDGKQETLMRDLQLEDKDPDHLLDFKTLDLSGILEKMQAFEKNNKYHLIGKVEIFNKENYGYNCSSLAYSLLKAGGINKLLTSSTAILQNYILVTPNGLAKILIQAKKQEDELLSNNSQKEKSTSEFKR